MPTSLRTKRFEAGRWKCVASEDEKLNCDRPCKTGRSSMPEVDVDGHDGLADYSVTDPPPDDTSRHHPHTGDKVENNATRALECLRRVHGTAHEGRLWLKPAHESTDSVPENDEVEDVGYDSTDDDATKGTNFELGEERGDEGGWGR